MNNKRGGFAVERAFVLSAGLALASCTSGQGAGENLAATEFGIDAGSCATTQNNVIGSPLAFNSADSYSNACGSNVTVADYIVPSNYANGYLRVGFGSNAPATQSDCEDSEARVVYYAQVAGSFVPQAAEVRSVGRWVTGPNPKCWLPNLTFAAPTSGATYRVAATVQHISSGATRSLSVTSIGPVSQLGVAGNHTCATLFGGERVRCWGERGNGGLGYYNLSFGDPRSDAIGDDETPSSAGDVDVGGPVAQLAVGGGHNCVLLTTGAVRCWGANQYGQLGYGNTNNIGDDESPASAGDVNVGGVVTQITAGSSQTCALLATGSVRCWGLAANGQLGYGNLNNIGDDETPASVGDVNVGGTVLQVAAGTLHTCALLTTGAVRCWGNAGAVGYANVNNNIGDNETPASAGSVNVGGTVSQVTLQQLGTCVRLSTGDLRCWGSQSGLGNGVKQNIGDNELPSTTPIVSLGGKALTVAMGYGPVVCAQLTTGNFRCWGSSATGQLGAVDIGYPNSHVNVTPVPSAEGDLSVWGGCADQSSEQSFAGDRAVGCAGSVSYANRNSLCAPGWSACPASSWPSLRAGSAPTHIYWTNDDLRWGGSPGVCTASLQTGNECVTGPMRICSGTSDAEGNTCNWTGCGVDDTSNQYMGGCEGNPTAGTLCCRQLTVGCADGTTEQVFAGGAVGCSGQVGYAARASLCGGGSHVCSAAEWAVLNDGTTPSHNYWTNDDLKFSGSFDACSVSKYDGNECSDPMRVCVPGGTDPEGNICNWTDCGLGAVSPNQYFGGCSGNPTAGSLCCPN